METNQCSLCGAPVTPESRTHLYEESGVPNVYLQGVEFAECKACSDFQISIPHVAKVHQALSLAIVKSPRLLTGSQLRFLRNHVELSRDQFAKYLGVDAAEVANWELGNLVPIGQSVDRLVRLLVVTLDKSLAEFAPSIASQISEIMNKTGDDVQFHIDVASLTFSHGFVKRAA